MGTVAQLTAEVKVMGVEQATSQLRTMGTVTDTAQSELNKLAPAAEEASSGIGSGFRSMVGSVLDFGAKIGQTIFGLESMWQAGTQLASALLGPAMSAEQMTSAFTTLMGSTKAATNELSSLAQFAAKTPFQTLDIDKAASQLLGFGINSKAIIPDLTAIGDALSAVGRGSVANLDSVVDIFGKIQNTGHLTGEIMQQFADNGINAWAILEKQTGKTQGQLQQMIAAGLFPANKAMDMLTKGIEANPMYAGGMAKQSATLSGIMSTLASNVNQVLGKFGDPILKAVEPLFTNIATSLSSPAFQSFAGSVGQGIVDVFKDIGGFIQSNVLPAFKQFGDMLSGLGKDKGINGFISSLKGGFDQIKTIVGGEVGKDFQQFGQTVQQVGTWFKTSMLPAIQQAMPGFEHLGSVLATNVAPALAKIWAVGQQLTREALPPLTRAFEAIAPIAVKVGGFLADNLAKALQFIAPFAVQAAQEIGKFATEIGTRVQPFVQGLATALKAFLDWIKPYWPQIWQSIQTVFVSTWDIIKGAIQIAWSVVSGVIKIGLDLLTGNWKQAWNDVKSMFSGIWEGIKSIASGVWANVSGPIMTGVNGFRGWWATTWDNVKKAFSITWDSLKNIASGAWNGIAGAIKSGINGVIGLIDNFIRGVNSIHVNLPGGTSIGFNIPLIPYLKEGGLIARAGLAVVGERGPEQVWLPAGAQVIPNNQSFGGAGQQPITNVYVSLDGYQVAGRLMPHIANHIRYGAAARF